MKTLFALSAICITALSCSKDQDKKEKFQNVCFQGIYVGTGCWDVIQVTNSTDKLEDYNSSWIKSGMGNGTEKFDHVIGISNLPQEYKTGDTFYFSINKIEIEPFHTQECSPTKYLAVLSKIGKTACDGSLQK